MASLVAGIGHLPSAAALAQGSLSSEGAPGSQIQRLQQQRAEATKELNPRPTVLSPAGDRPSSRRMTNLPADDPYFSINEVVLEDNAFDWLGRFLQPVVGQCIGKTALKRIQDPANNALIERGFITSRVFVPAQSLEAGRLVLSIVPGRIGDVHADKPSIGWLKGALPTSHGALLNQRDLDQGLENLRRLQSQSDATFDIAPGINPADSEIVLHPGTGKRWHAMFAVDNGGLHSTGKTSLSGSLTYDSPFHLYDQLQIAGSTNANLSAPGEGNQSALVNCSVPVGWPVHKPA